MKKLFYLCLCALMACFTACKDDDNSQSQHQPTTEDGQYLVMFYGVGGGNLDEDIARNILQALEVGSSDKVKMTFQYRFSKSYQQIAEDSIRNTKSILRIDADDNAHLKAAFDATSDTLNDTDMLWKYYNTIRSTALGDTSYIMAIDTALTSYINWSKAKHPDATKTILIINDHGGGWHLYLDGYKDMINGQTTRSILSDDNTPDKFHPNIAQNLSVGDVKRALAEAGGVDVLYDDACLMSTWENLTGYSSAARYFLGSLEIAPLRGGNYHYLVSRLAQNRATDEGLESAIRGYIDDIIDEWWRDRKGEAKIYGDMNLYNLQKIDAPLNIIRQAAQTLTEKWQSTTPIQGISDTAALGTEWKNYIRPAITKCVISTDFLGQYVPASLVPKPLQEYLASQGCKTKRVGGKESYWGGHVLYAMKHADMEELDPNGEYRKQYMELWTIYQKFTADSYPFSDFLRVIVKNLREAGLDDGDNPFVDYQKQYIDAIKDMGYIRCTHPLPDSAAEAEGMIDYAYNCCSPGVFIYSFDKAVYEKTDDITYRWAQTIPNVETAIKTYQSCDFDKKTSWSSVLCEFDQIPSIVDNPVRRTDNDK